MIVNSRELLKKAKENKDVIYQFNANNLEWVKYILEKIEELNKPIILAFSEGATKYMGGFTTVGNVVKGLVADLDIKTDIVLHLDHGSSFETCKKAIENGFTSVMYDGSKYPLEENIRNTKQIVAYSKEHNVTVEGELGYVGTVADGVSYTNLEDAIYYVNETNVDSLAPAVGNAHGIYKDVPKINFELICELREKTNLPLVLHGGSGLSTETFKKCVENGICKININTELQVAWAQGVREFLESNKEVYDPRKVIGSGEDNIKSAVEKYLTLF